MAGSGNMNARWGSKVTDTWRTLKANMNRSGQPTSNIQLKRSKKETLRGSIQHPTLYEHVFVSFDQYSKLHNEYHQHVQQRLHVPWNDQTPCRRWSWTNAPFAKFAGFVSFHNSTSSGFGWSGFVSTYVEETSENIGKKVENVAIRFIVVREKINCQGKKKCLSMKK